jgi:hypothetical protein
MVHHTPVKVQHHSPTLLHACCVIHISDLGRGRLNPIAAWSTSIRQPACQVSARHSPILGREADNDDIAFAREWCLLEPTTVSAPRSHAHFFTLIFPVSLSLFQFPFHFSSFTFTFPVSLSLFAGQPRLPCLRASPL